jgi:hypothetical protein
MRLSHFMLGNRTSGFPATERALAALCGRGRKEVLANALSVLVGREIGQARSNCLCLTSATKLLVDLKLLLVAEAEVTGGNPRIVDIIEVAKEDMFPFNVDLSTPFAITRIPTNPAIARLVETRQARRESHGCHV